MPLQVPPSMGAGGGAQFGGGPQLSPMQAPSLNGPSKRPASGGMVVSEPVPVSIGDPPSPMGGASGRGMVSGRLVDPPSSKASASTLLPASVPVPASSVLPPPPASRTVVPLPPVEDQAPQGGVIGVLAAQRLVTRTDSALPDCSLSQTPGAN